MSATQQNILLWAAREILPDCTDDYIPTQADLYSWFPTAPTDVLEDADDTLEKIYGHRGWQWMTYLQGQTRFSNPELAAALSDKQIDEPILLAIMDYVPNGFAMMDLVAVHDFWKLYARVCRTNNKEPSEHPAITLVRGWQNRPRRIRFNTRSDRIFPAGAAMVPASDKRAGRLFMPAARADPDGQLSLPGFERERQSVALPLALYDLGDMPASKGGPGAPLSLRLFIESILAVPLDERTGDLVCMSVTLRDLLARLYPGPRPPRPTEYWPRLEAAINALDSRAARIPWFDPETGIGGLRRVVNLSDIPRGPGALDDLLTVTVHLPPGATSGPKLSPRLGKWGKESAAAYRALLNLPLQWYAPGKTLIPTRRGGRRKGRVWIWNQNPRAFPKLTDELIVDALYPTSTRNSRRKLVYEGHKIITRLTTAGEIRIVHGHLLPPAGSEPSQ